MLLFSFFLPLIPYSAPNLNTRQSHYVDMRKLILLTLRSSRRVQVTFRKMAQYNYMKLNYILSYAVLCRRSSLSTRFYPFSFPNVTMSVSVLIGTAGDGVTKIGLG